MPARKANSSGRWSQSIWDVTPAAGDDVFANGFTVEIDQNINVGSLRTTLSSGYAAAGGGFTLFQPLSVILTGDVIREQGTPLVSYLSSGTATLVCRNIFNIGSGATTLASFGFSLVPVVINTSTGNLVIDASNITGAAFTAANNGLHTVINTGAGNVYVTCNAISASPTYAGSGILAGSSGIINHGIGGIYANSNVVGGTTNSYGILNNSIGHVVINGNLFAGSASPAVFQNSTGTLLVNGNIYASPNANGVVSGSTAARNQFTGALINSDNGRQAVYAARYLLKPKVFDSYTFHRNTELVNLLTFSEQIDNAAWVKTATTVTANVSTNPLNSAFTGDRLVETVATGAHLTYRSFSTALSGLSSSTDTTFRPLDLVFSVYARQATNDRRYMVLGIDSGSTAGASTPAGTNAFSAIYDLQTGTMPALTSTGSGVVTLSSIENVGSGWYRCMIEGRINNATTPWNIFPTIAISDRADYSGTRVTTHYPSYAGNVLSGIAVWGAQFEYNSLTPYVSSEVFQGFANRSAQPVFFYSPEAYALSYVPHVSSVRLGTRYAAVSTLSGVAVNITEQLTGTMVVPSERVVSLGTLVGQTTGTAINTSQLLEQVWNTNINTLTAANAIGTRLKNAVTVQEVGTATVNL